MRLLHLQTLLAIVLAPTLASAATLSYTGSLDPNNADDVFLTSFTLVAPADLTIQSFGYGGTSDAPGGTNAAGKVIAAGGFDSYVSLFLGSGPTATFLASNDDGSCGPAHPDPICEDSRLSLTGLAAATYTLALTLPGNFSFAENYGSGDLGDGFIGLQGDYYDPASNSERTSNYAVDVSSSAITPEPASILLMLTGLAAPAGLVLLRRS